MPLNVSRESMQDTRLLEKLSIAVVRRFLKHLERESKKDPARYLTFYKNYSYYLKAGLLEDKTGGGGRHKDDLLKLLRFDCTNIKGDEVGTKLISLQEYVDQYRVKNSNSSTGKEQKQIYYYCCPSRETAMNSPYMEDMIARKRPVLLMYEDIDEYVVSSTLESFGGYNLVAVDSQGKDFELDLEETPVQLSTGPKGGLGLGGEHLTAAETKEMSKWLQSEKVLGKRCSEVKWTDRLTSSPGVVTSVMTPHMRKLMKQMMQANGGGANGGGGGSGDDFPMTLELSGKHAVIKTIFRIRETNEEVAIAASKALFDNALIAAGACDEPRSVLGRLNQVLEMAVFQGAGFDYKTGKFPTDSSDGDKVVDSSEEKPIDDTASATDGEKSSTSTNPPQGKLETDRIQEVTSKASA